MATGYEPLNTLKEIGKNIWIVDAPVIKFYGMPFTTRMTVMRLQNGDLMLHSPCAICDELKQAVSALGTVKHLISPNWIHYAYIYQWAVAFPDAISWASPNVRKRAEKYQSDVVFDRDLSALAETDWAHEVEQMIVPGSKVHEEVVFFHKASETLILTDLIENFEPKHVPWWFRPIIKLAGISDPDGQMPCDMRMTFRAGRKKLRGAIEAMIGWGPKQIIVAHGRWYDRNAVAELRRAFRWVLTQD
ncbi:MAG: DUF4336 domain-containing protein [Amylibacter sp.]|nr:DUF4336 domain-containing protein [Amylibacter sp.]